ncbi:MAG TPA: copper resistance protein NlpE N-terminal domain-containing protein [Thermomonas sp.]|nr:copper resistance protein NlpE N-terminal domain-containing protein [Thermomonas sp.]
MPLRRSIVLLTLAWLLAACEAASPGGATATTPATSSAMEFRGQRPCVDCDGIDAWLRLEQEGKARRFRLVEHYRAEGGDRRFEDEGEWQAEGDLLRLRSQGGGERVYARLAEGMLQARDARGRALPAMADEVMVPVTFDTAH